LPSIPTITSTGTITSCFGGALTLSVSAGSTSYSWNTLLLCSTSFFLIQK
jgi:hypothetical protein